MKQNDPLGGALYLTDGLRIITEPGLRRFVVVPLVVNVVLFGLALWGLYFWLGQVLQWAESKLPAFLHFLGFLLIPLFVVAAALFVFFCFALLANLIAAPFNGLLAEAVERRLRRARGETVSMPESDWHSLIGDAGASIVSELGKLAYFLPRALALALLGLFPPFTPIATPLWLLFSAWMMALSYLDYPMGNHGVGFAEQRRRLRGRRLTCIGFGVMASVGIVVPLANLIVMPAAVAGATKLWLERIEPNGPWNGPGTPSDR